MVSSTIHTVWKKRARVINASEQNGSGIKRFRKPERRDVDEGLLMWFK